jgi:hypothetical protein
MAMPADGAIARIPLKAPFPRTDPFSRRGGPDAHALAGDRAHSRPAGRARRGAGRDTDAERCWIRDDLGHLGRRPRPRRHVHRRRGGSAAVPLERCVRVRRARGAGRIPAGHRSSRAHPRRGFCVRRARRRDARALERGGAGRGALGGPSRVLGLRLGRVRRRLRRGRPARGPRVPVDRARNVRARARRARGAGRVRRRRVLHPVGAARPAGVAGVPLARERRDP